MPNTTNYDPEAFAEFFGTHRTDANVPDDDTNATASATNTTDDGAAQTENLDDVGAPPDTTSAQSDNGAGATSQVDESQTDNDQTKSSQAQQQSNNNTKQNNANLAFAQMRTQNKRQQQVLNSIAQQLGVQDTSDPDAVLNALQTLTTKAQAQKQGIPEEVLSKLQMLEAKEEERQKESYLIAAGRGFQALKTKHSLTDADLNSFADELIADGINPYEQPVDLLKEYRNRHFDDLINAAVQKGIQQEAARSAKASRQSTTPSHSSGSTVSAPEGKINTVEGLNKWLEEHAQ